MTWIGRAALVCLGATAGGCVTARTVGGTSAQTGIATGFINKRMVVNGKERWYVVYVPRPYDPMRPWPVVLFLHGAGERGNDGLIQTEIGVGPAIRRWPDRFPCLVVMPQCPKDVWWDKAADDIDLALAQTMREYSVDRSRVYLTGLSMGGYAAWMYGAARTDTFAALMPICGGGKLEDAATLAKIPIWAFHGADDKTVDPAESRKMIEAVRKAGGKVRYTEYPDTQHNSWDKAYADPHSIKWLLKQRRES